VGKKATNQPKKGKVQGSINFTCYQEEKKGSHGASVDQKGRTPPSKKGNGELQLIPKKA